MTIEEAALHLERLYGIVSEEYKRALDVVDDAFFKQVAKKVIYTESERPHCPNCGQMFMYATYPKCSDYCPECGQKLKWEDTVEKSLINTLVPISVIRQNIKDMPTVQPKKGKWIWDENGMDWGIGSWRCSACDARPETNWQCMGNFDPLQWNGSKFCPNCGAEMEEEE